MVERTAVLLASIQLLLCSPPSVVAFTLSDTTTAQSAETTTPLHASTLPFSDISSPNPTLYDLLGVSRTASPAELKARYHQLAQRYHPDSADGGDATVFGQIAAAYHELRDARPTYDRRIVADQCVEVLSHLVATTAVHTWRTVQGATQHVVAQVQQQQQQQQRPAAWAATAAAMMERCFPTHMRNNDDRKKSLQQAAALERQAEALLASAAQQQQELEALVLDRLRHTLHIPTKTTSVSPWAKQQRPLPPRNPPNTVSPLTSAEAELWIQHHLASHQDDPTLGQYLAALKEREGVLIQQQHVDDQLHKTLAAEADTTAYLRDAVHTSASELVRLSAETAHCAERVRRWIVAHNKTPSRLRWASFRRSSSTLPRERQLHAQSTAAQQTATQLAARARRLRRTPPVWPWSS